MKIAKEFNWDMGHRLLFHKGKCRNLHGHSYKLIIELEGAEDVNGMVMDYYDVRTIVSPVLEQLDHSVMVYEKDAELYEALKSLNTKMTVVPFESTAENITRYFLNEIAGAALPANIQAIKIRVCETSDTYAEEEIRLR